MYITHGLYSKHKKAHYIWRGMMARCHNPKNKAFCRYGQRGISVCLSWHNFANFLKDMGEPPIGLTLERLNNDGNYEPSNCRWVSMKSQMNNRRSNHYITFEGRTQTRQQWIDEINIPKSTFANRLKRGWSIQKILHTSIRGQGFKLRLTEVLAIKKFWQKNVLSQSKIAERFEVKRGTINSIINGRSWSKKLAEIGA
ncbi:MAG TPA: helix-turn-helix transcriptional regulator [Gammaproteobacteria bacterium]|nr:helix-turn-helix transcriptional regulator [Gammaproteobacteria bacterium]